MSPRFIFLFSMKLCIMSIVIHITLDLPFMYVSINCVYDYMFETICLKLKKMIADDLRQ